MKLCIQNWIGPRVGLLAIGWSMLGPSVALAQDFSMTQALEAIRQRTQREIARTSASVASRAAAGGSPLAMQYSPGNPPSLTTYFVFPKDNLPEPQTRLAPENQLRLAIKKQDARRILGAASHLSQVTEDRSVLRPYQQWVDWARQDLERRAQTRGSVPMAIQSDYYDGDGRLVRGRFHLAGCVHSRNGVDGTPGQLRPVSQLADGQRCPKCLPTETEIAERARIQQERRLGQSAISSILGEVK
jgi:hypothetical protein